MLNPLDSIRLGDKFVSVKNKNNKVIVLDKKVPKIVFQYLSNKKISRLDAEDFYVKYRKIAC